MILRLHQALSLLLLGVCGLSPLAGLWLGWPLGAMLAFFFCPSLMAVAWKAVHARQLPLITGGPSISSPLLRH